MPDPADAVDRHVRALVERFELPPASLPPLRGLIRALSEDPQAPTTLRDPRRIIDDHLADSLVGLELSEVSGARAIADLGAGAGLPGVALAIAKPDAHVYLVESVGRKALFMERLLSGLGVTNAEVIARRAEEWTEGTGRCDLVTARALAPLDVVAEYAAPLLRVGGSLVAWRGKPDPQVEADGARAAEILGLSVRPAVPVAPYQGVESRYLHVMSKVMETPAGFPRRPGMARKRPLGSRGRPV